METNRKAIFPSDKIDFKKQRESYETKGTT